MFKSAKFFTAVGVFLVIALVGGLYLTSKKAVNQEPIIVFKTVMPKKAKATSTATISDSSGGERDSSFSLEAPSEHVHEHPPQEHKSHWSDETFTDESENNVSLSEEIEKLTNNEHTDESLELSKRVHDQMERLASQIETEYSELLELQNITLEEMDALSEAEKERISELSLQFQAEYLGEIQTLLSQFPPAHLEGILSALQETYDQQWGTEFADQLVSEMRTYLQR